MLRRREAAKKEAARAAPYAKERSEDDMLEGLADRLVTDLREAIRGLVVHEVFSSEWMEQTVVLKRIATVVTAEDSFGEESKDATLWETEEATMRHMLELGKLNILLRMLEEFKSAQQQMDLDGDSRLTELRFQKAAEVFERSVCTVLVFALKHDEVAQTVDVNLLVTILRDCMQDALLRPDELTESLTGLLEAQVFAMTAPLVAQADEVSEDRVAAPLSKANFFGFLTRHLVTNLQRFSQGDRDTALKAIAAYIDTEMFELQAEKLFTDPVQVSALLQLEDLATEALQRDDALRKALRPLVDEIKRQKRMATK